MSETVTYIREVFDPVTSETLSEVQELYGTFDWGQGLLSYTVDPDGLDLVTTNTYDQNGRLSQSVRPDGSWTIYAYDASGRVETEYSAYLNQGPTSNAQLGRTTTYSYTTLGSPDVASVNPNSPRVVTESIQGTPVRRTFMLYLPGETRQYQAASASADWDDADNLGTTNRYIASGTDIGQPLVTDHPDGTRQSYVYGSTPTTRTVTFYSGQADPNNTSNILSGTKTVTTQGSYGETLSTVVYDYPGGAVVDYQANAFDELGRLTNSAYLDSTQTHATYQDCCNVSTQTDREGIATTFYYDDLRRQVAAVRNNISLTNHYGPDPNRVLTYRIAQGTNAIQVGDATYDPAGRLVWRYDALDQLSGLGVRSPGHRRKRDHPDALHE